MKRNRIQVVVARGQRKGTYRAKTEYLRPRGLWGFNVPEPKPWKRSKSRIA